MKAFIIFFFDKEFGPSSFMMEAEDNKEAEEQFINDCKDDIDPRYCVTTIMMRRSLTKKERDFMTSLQAVRNTPAFVKEGRIFDGELFKG